MTLNILGKTFLSVLCAVTLFTACSDDDDNSPFVGLDNNMLSFSLTQGATTWQAAIDDNEIVITVPEGTELAGATATYRLSEQAAIFPDPAGINLWNEEQQFVVKSYNQTRRTYKYTIQYTPVSEVANITLNSQAEVDAFGTHGVTAIEGSLFIGLTENTTDPIMNLNGLSKLTEVMGQLQIGQYYQGENLDGLAKIKRTGSILITTVGTGVAKNLKSVSFPALTLIRRDLNLYNGKQIESLSMPLLKTILGNSEIQETSITSFNMNSLQQVGGSIIFNSNQLTDLEFPDLESIGDQLYLYASTSGAGFPKLTTINLPILGTCSRIRFEGAESLETLRIPKLKALSTLSFQKSLSFTDINTTIKDLESIETLTLSSTSVLQLDATGKTIEKLTISPNGTDQFTLTGKDTFGDIEFANNNQAPLPILVGINTIANYSIRTARGSVSLDGVKAITGSLSTNPVTMNVLDELLLPDLESVGSIKTHLGSNGVATRLNAPKLTEVTGSLALTVNTSQADLSYINLPVLSKVGGELNIAGKTTSQQTITQINCFPKLSSVGEVTIKGFKKLFNFSPFKPMIEQVSKWTVTYCGSNPTLQQMKDSPTGDFSNN